MDVNMAQNQDTVSDSNYLLGTQQEVTHLIDWIPVLVTFFSLFALRQNILIDQENSPTIISETLS